MPENLSHHGVDGLVPPEGLEPSATPVELLRESELEAALASGGEPLRAFVAVHEFKAKAGQVLPVTGADGRLARVLVGLGSGDRVDSMLLRGLSAKLSPGDYRLAAVPEGIDADALALAWALGRYTFDRYRS